MVSRESLYYTSQVAHQAEAYPSFCTMKDHPGTYLDHEMLSKMMLEKEKLQHLGNASNDQLLK